MRPADGTSENGMIPLSERRSTMDPAHDTRANDAPSGDGGVSRRNFIRTAALLDGSSLLASSLSACVGQPVKVGEPTDGARRAW